MKYALAQTRETNPPKAIFHPPVFLLSFFLALMTTPLLAQHVQVSGRLVDETSGQAVSYGAIRIEGMNYGAISNVEGEFEFKFPEELLRSRRYLIVSSIGYHNYRFRLSQLEKGEYLLFRLRERPYTLDEVMIYSIDLTARQLVAEAFARIPQNYPKKPYQLKTFYRHYCKEGDTYGRLIEAAVDVYDSKGHKKLRRWPGGKLELKVQQLRRSFDFTSMATANRHMPISLNTTLLHDFVSYRNRLSQNVLNEKYTFQYTDTTFYDDQLVYVVLCKSKNYENTIYISAADLAFLRLEEYKYISSDNKQKKYWRKEHYITTYKKQDQKYYLSHLTNEGENETILQDSLGREIDRSGHYHHVEIMTNEILTSNFQKFHAKEPGKEELLKIPYNASFWEKYNILKATPLEAKIESDLASRMPLEQQFADFHKQETDPHFHDRLMAQTFDVLLNQQRGKVVLVYFWDSTKLPSLKEILMARKMAKNFNADVASLGAILISMEPDANNWQKTIKKKGIAGNSHLRLALGAASPLAKRFGVQGAPHYLIFDKEGNLALNEAKLPKREKVERELRSLLDI